MKKRTILFFAVCVVVVIAIVEFSVYQSNNRSSIDRINQAILQSPDLETGSYDVDLLMESLPDQVRKAIIEVVPDHIAFETHTGTWFVTKKGFATKQGIFLSTEVIPEIPKVRNLGIAIEPLGNVNRVYTYLLQYYWD